MAVDYAGRWPFYALLRAPGKKVRKVAVDTRNEIFE
jgi:hypothetical protein